MHSCTFAARGALWRPLAGAALIAFLLTHTAGGQNADFAPAGQQTGTDDDASKMTARLEESIARQTAEQNFAAAGQSWRELASLRTKSLGETHWQTIEA